MVDLGRAKCKLIGSRSVSVGFLNHQRVWVLDFDFLNLGAKMVVVVGPRRFWAKVVGLFFLKN